MAMTLTGADQVRAHVGAVLGVSDWHEVTQEAVDRFADVTGDHQFIHVDPVRAAQTPMGGTVAHGFFTLSIGPMLMNEIVAFEGFAMALNYGLNRVRFPAPLRVGERVRLQARLTEAQEIPGGLSAVLEQTFTAQNTDKPVCVAESVVRFYTAA